MRTTRLEAFSDGVIAILITIMVLELKTPEGSDWTALRSLGAKLGAYVLSFVFIGIYWNNHHHMLHMTERVNGAILWMNLHLLFWLSLIPFGTAWVGHTGLAPVPTATYGAILMLAGVAYYILETTIIRSQGPQSRLKSAVGSDAKGIASVVMYASAIGIAFVHPWIAEAIYLAVAVMWLVPDRGSKGGCGMNRPAVRAYLLAIVTIGAAVSLTRSTWPLFAAAPFAPIFGAVALTSHFGSEPAGLLAVGLGAVLAPVALGGNVHWDPRIIVFVAIGVFGAHVIASRKRTLRALRASEAELRATVAAQRQAAADLERSEQKLRHAQKLEAVGQLVAGVAHNFNNLLTVTMGYTDLLLDRHPNGDADHDHLQEIRQATNRGASLTRQLLAFGHKHAAKRAYVNLTRAVADLRDILRRVIREDITLVIDAPSEALAIVGDPHDIEQIVLNLVLNARDALPEGGTIRIDVDRVHIDATSVPKDVAAEPGEYVLLRVRDDGTGMTPEVQGRLFEPFFTTKEVGQGTGLGLAFVHGIARQAGGCVTIETAPGEGTTVTVFFPPAPSARPEEAPQHPPPVTVPTAEKGATILLVEDEVIVRNMAARALSRAGYGVLSAGTPSEAIALFRDHGASVALLLTDVVMPEMHGPALARQLSAQRPDLPVLFMSGYSDSIPADAGGTEHAAFLAKPFAPADLVAAVAELIVSR